jgi:arginyl-tRNA synthetase
MTFWSLLEIIDKALTVVLLVGGLVVFACKAWIVEWIKRRFSQQLGQSMEDYRHKLATEMESYKSGLLRDLEKFRANVDIKRSVALRMAEQRLDALRSFSVAFDRFANEATSMCTMPKELRIANLEEYNEAVGAFRREKRASEIFLSVELNREITKVGAGIIKLASDGIHKDIVLTNQDPTLFSAMSDIATISLKLRKEIHKPPPIPD